MPGEPFELVTEMYALPKYYEKDPNCFSLLLCFLWHDGHRYRLWTVVTLATGFCP